MRSETAGTTPGLGTSIIEALAKQLHARVQVADARPGTAVSIMRTALAEPSPKLSRPRPFFRRYIKSQEMQQSQ